MLVVDNETDTIIGQLMKIEVVSNDHYLVDADEYVTKSAWEVLYIDPDGHLRTADITDVRLADMPEEDDDE